MPTSVDPLVLLAQKTIESYVRSKKTPQPPTLMDTLPKQAACFVTIHLKSTGELRGCIGTIEPANPTLAEEIIQNAVSAATQDPRFEPLSEEELADISVSVDVLFPPEPAKLEDLDPKRYGVIVSQGFKRGLLLPDLEGVDSATYQVRIACSKAGIDPESKFDLEKFEVIRHL
jgi:AmmeMemoRadiSam system protein A